MKYLLLLILFVPNFIFSQDPDPIEPLEIEEEVNVEQEDEIFTVVEIAPTFPEGEGAMHQFIVKNINYPAVDIENGVQGKVYLKFVIELDGSITNIKIMRGLSSTIDAECIRVVKRMPKWTAGESSGKKVRCYYAIPVTFKLEIEIYPNTLFVIIHCLNELNRF